MFLSSERSLFFSCENEMHLQRLACLYSIPLHIKEITQQQQQTKYNYSLLDKFSSLPVAKVSNSLEAQLKIFNVIIAFFFSVLVISTLVHSCHSSLLVSIFVSKSFH